MRKLTLVVIGLTSLCAFQIGISRIVGASDWDVTFAAILRRDTEIQNGVWCWRGICPGQTTIGEARQAILPIDGVIAVDMADSLQMSTQGYSIFIYNHQGLPAPVSVIKIDALPFSLADLINEFGSPQLIQPFAYPADWRWQRAIRFGKYLWANIVCSQPSDIDLQCKVSEISFLSPHIKRDTTSYRRWKG